MIAVGIKRVGNWRRRKKINSNRIIYDNSSDFISRVIRISKIIHATFSRCIRYDRVGFQQLEASERGDLILS